LSSSSTIGSFSGRAQLREWVTFLNKQSFGEFDFWLIIISRETLCSLWCVRICIKLTRKERKVIRNPLLIVSFCMLICRLIGKVYW
jgi:hypothetical protein